MQKELNTKMLLLLIAVAYIFSIIVRFSWVYQNSGVDEYIWNGSYILSTNDGYYFASGVQKILYGMHLDNPLVPSAADRGLVFVTALLAKILPISLDTLIFYMPAIFASLIVIPLVLIGNLYKKAYWGFLAALIAGVAWSYYKRTMLGYYDSDMFSLSILMFFFYYILATTVNNNLRDALIASLFAILYEYLYHPGNLVLSAIVFVYVFYQIIFNKDKNYIYQSLILIFISITPFPIAAPFNHIIKAVVVIALFYLFKNREFKKNDKTLLVALAISFILFLIFGDAVSGILSKIKTYTETGVEHKGLKFFGVFQTIAEANGIPFFSFGEQYEGNIADRVIGSPIAFIIALAAYIYLIYKRKEFILALPLLAIGLFAHWGGLRFTIYAIPIAALSITYAFIEIAKTINDNKLKYAIPFLLTIVVLIPTLNFIPKHNKRVRPVFIKSEINDLTRLKKIAKSKDFTLSWWDYGYPIWYYTNTNTLIDGAKHRHDNFVISKILLSDSSTLAANLSRLAVEEYVKSFTSYKEFKNKGSNIDDIPKNYLFSDKKGNQYHAGNPMQAVISYLLKDNQKNQQDPNEFLAKLNSDNYPLPPKTRDIYLYMPIKSVNIFPAIVQFGNLDLTNGKPLRRVVFMPSYIYKSKNGILTLIYQGSILGDFDTKRGIIHQKNGDIPLDKLIVAQTNKQGDIKLNAFKFNNNSNLSMIFVKSLNQMILVDSQTLNSNYVKMFLLGLYDKDKFELVDKSPYGRVYKLKR